MASNEFLSDRFYFRQRFRSYSFLSKFESNIPQLSQKLLLGRPSLFRILRLYSTPPLLGTHPAPPPDGGHGFFPLFLPGLPLLAVFLKLLLPFLLLFRHCFLGRVVLQVLLQETVPILLLFQFSFTDYSEETGHRLLYLQHFLPVFYRHAVLLGQVRVREDYVLFSEKNVPQLVKVFRGF